MQNIKTLWTDNKDKLKGAAIGVASTSVVTAYLIHKTKISRQLTSFEIIDYTESGSPTGKILAVKHRDGEEGFYNINN